MREMRDCLVRLNRWYDGLDELARLSVGTAAMLPALGVAGPPWMGAAGLAWALAVFHVRERYVRGRAGCRHLTHHMRPCRDHADDPDPAACPDVLFVRGSDGCYGIPVRDGGSSYVRIRFCPFCGRPLRVDRPGGAG